MHPNEQATKCKNKLHKYVAVICWMREGEVLEVADEGPRNTHVTSGAGVMGEAVQRSDLDSFAKVNDDGAAIRPDDVSQRRSRWMMCSECIHST